MVRWGVGELLEGGSFPWATIVVNTVGCALLAAIVSSPRSLPTTDALAVGFCGGLTTFSTLAVESVELADDGRTGIAAVYVVASLGAGMAAFLVVRALGRRVRT